MRWWLALVFAAIAALTALAVAQVFTGRAEQAFRARAVELAVGNTVRAASEIARAPREVDVLQRRVDALARERRLALFVFDAHGRLLTTRRSRDVVFGGRPEHRLVFRSALGGERRVDILDGGGTIVVGLPLRGGAPGALVGVASGTDVIPSLGIVRSRIGDSALIAVGVGAVVGFAVALLIAARVGRVVRATEAIARGQFDVPLRRHGFPDEVGRLVATVDQMRERLHESFALIAAERDRLAVLFEQLHEGVVAVDRDLRVQVANGAAQRALAAALEPGSPLPDPWSGISLRALAEGLFSGGRTVVQARAVPDERHAYAIAGIPAGRDSDMAVLVLAEVSDRERRELAEREFVANAAHELRTPIAAITTAMDALRSGAQDEPVARARFLDVIERQSTRLARLVRALLVLARAQTRQEPVRLEPVALRPLLDEAAAAIDVTDDVEVVVECDEHLHALAQRDLAMQVLANLASNATKHVDRGTIVFAARCGLAGDIVIEVRDDGEGIAAGDQDRIFDRFYSGGDSREGFGLGLAIVREAVRSLGGVVEIESERDRGTIARVTLAAVPAEVVA